MEKTFNGFDSAIIKGPMPGEVLREARRARDLSMQYIANQLRLSIEIVDALENDDYKNLPASAFVQGYIRNYAALLGLNAEPLLTQYILRKEEEAVSTVRKKRKIGKDKSSRRHVLPVRSFSYVVSLGVIVAAMALIYNSSNNVADNDLTDTPTTTGKRSAAKGPASVEEFGVSSAAKDKTAVAKTAEPVKKQRHLDTLSIKFNKSSYIEVLDANNKQLLRARGIRGYRAKVTGTAPFRVKLTQPKNIVVKLNGRLIKHISGKSSGVHSGGSRTIIVKAPARTRHSAGKHARNNTLQPADKVEKTRRAQN